MESRYWGNVKSNSRPVTISKDGQTFHFRTFKDCAKFIADFEGLKASKWRQLLTLRAEIIAGWKIFYD